MHTAYLTRLMAAYTVLYQYTLQAMKYTKFINLCE
jgi:hypothetical protein